MLSRMRRPSPNILETVYILVGSSVAASEPRPCHVKIISNRLMMTCDPNCANDPISNFLQRAVIMALKIVNVNIEEL